MSDAAPAEGRPPESRPPLPPFTEETAKKKIQAAEDAWNSRDPGRASRLAYTPDTEWRNRNEFLNGRDAVREFLSRKMAARTRLPAQERIVVLCRQPYRRAL